MSIDADPEKLYRGLIEHRLIVPTGVQGTFARSAAFEDVLARFDALVMQTAKDDRAEPLTFPPVMNRRVLEKAGYLESFPHLCGAVASFRGDDTQAQELSERIHRGESWMDLLELTDVAMNPAACYPVYPTLAGVIPDRGRLITVLNWVFRHEPSNEPTRLQAFRMREFIRVGGAEEVVAWREMWLDRSLNLLQSLGLPVAPDAASDPFFGRAGEMLASGQRERRLKIEILMPIISNSSPTAICSFNYHEEHFSSPFDIRMADGALAKTGCLGFGLERIVMALFKTHGFDIAEWPAEVRKRLWN